jgi:hypothetical protein
MFDFMERMRAPELFSPAHMTAPTPGGSTRPPVRGGAAAAPQAVDERGQRMRDALGELYVDDGDALPPDYTPPYVTGEPMSPDAAAPLQLGSKPNVVAAHGTERDNMITADRPVTFYTQSGYALPENLALEIENDSPSLVDAWSKWSEHVTKGGTREDFEPEGALESFWNVWALEGARSELPGTEFRDVDLAPLALDDKRAPSSSVVKGQRDEHPDAAVSLGQILSRGLIPGIDPLVVAACRGEGMYFDPTLPKYARDA